MCQTYSCYQPASEIGLVNGTTCTKRKDGFTLSIPGREDIFLGKECRSRLLSCLMEDGFEKTFYGTVESFASGRMLLTDVVFEYTGRDGKIKTGTEDHINILDGKELKKDGLKKHDKIRFSAVPHLYQRVDGTYDIGLKSLTDIRKIDEYKTPLHFSKLSVPEEFCGRKEVSTERLLNAWREYIRNKNHSEEILNWNDIKGFRLAAFQIRIPAKQKKELCFGITARSFYRPEITAQTVEGRDVKEALASLDDKVSMADVVKSTEFGFKTCVQIQETVLIALCEDICGSYEKVVGASHFTVESCYKVLGWKKIDFGGGPRALVSFEFPDIKTAKMSEVFSEDFCVNTEVFKIQMDGMETVPVKSGIQYKLSEGSDLREEEASDYRVIKYTLTLPVSDVGSITNGSAIKNGISSEVFENDNYLAAENEMSRYESEFHVNEGSAELIEYAVLNSKDARVLKKTELSGKKLVDLLHIPVITIRKNKYVLLDIGEENKKGTAEIHTVPYDSSVPSLITKCSEFRANKERALAGTLVCGVPKKLSHECHYNLFAFAGSVASHAEDAN